MLLFDQAVAVSRRHQHLWTIDLYIEGEPEIPWLLQSWEYQLLLHSPVQLRWEQTSVSTARTLPLSLLEQVQSKERVQWRFENPCLKVIRDTN